MCSITIWFHVMSFPNYTSTDLVIENQAVRFIWAGWFLFVVFASLIGDTFILIASIRCKSIRLPAVIVVFIQHVAVSDLVTAVSSLVMQAVSLIANKWIFGAALCYMRAYFTFIGYNASSLLVSGMATSKLLILKYPLRASAWTAGQAHKACAVLWILSLYWPICFLSVDRGDLSFDYMLYACTYEFTSPKWEYLQRTSFIILVIVPTFTVSATAVLILVVARRVARDARQGLRWQGVLTVVLTAAAHSFSFLPIATYHISLPLVEEGPYKVSFCRMAVSFLAFSVIANFSIYCLTFNGFRHFLRHRALWITSCFCNVDSNQGKFLLSPPQQSLLSSLLRNVNKMLAFWSIKC